MTVTPLVSLRDVQVTLEGVPILRGVHASIARGKVTAILGLNGSGKTTLLRAILREVPYTGEIRFHCGHDHRSHLPQQVGYVPQRLRLETSLPFTVRDLLATALTRRPAFLGVSRASHARFAGMLERVGAPIALLDRPVERISGGELQRVLLALALEPDPELLLLDEPAAGIDFKDQEGFYSLIQRLNAERRTTVLLVSHDTGIVHQHAHHVLCLRDGEVACQGTPEEIMSPESLQATFGLGAKAYRHTH